MQLVRDLAGARRRLALGIALRVGAGGLGAAAILELAHRLVSGPTRTPPGLTSFLALVNLLLLGWLVALWTRIPWEHWRACADAAARTLEVDEAGLRVPLVALGPPYRDELLDLREPQLSLDWEDLGGFEDDGSRLRWLPRDGEPPVVLRAGDLDPEDRRRLGVLSGRHVGGGT